MTHDCKIVTREFAGVTQHRAECDGCMLFTSMWTVDRARAVEDGKIHTKAAKQRDLAAEKKKK